MEIYLIRHTAPDIAKGICYGQADVPLLKPIEHALNRVGEAFPPDIDVVYTSPLSRCMILAQHLAALRNIPIHTDVRLKELNFGTWELKAWDDIDPTVLLPWMDNYDVMSCPEGESYSHLVARVRSFIDDIKASGVDRVAVVTHAGVIRASHVVLHNMALRDSMEVVVEYGGIYRERCQ